MAILRFPNSFNLEKSQYLNYLAILMLEKLGNLNPTQEDIDGLESILAKLPYPDLDENTTAAALA